MLKYNSRKYMPPEDREEIDSVKDEIRSEGGRDRVEDEINDARSNLVDNTLNRLNEYSYEELSENDDY